jgi:acylphosphatase
VKSARRAIVTGRVQGVGFRFFALRAAQQSGVTGWVRNLPDGNVETLVEGDLEEIDRYLSRLRSGPGRVSSIDAQDVPAEGFETFEITR